MQKWLGEMGRSLRSIVYPHCCTACGSNVLPPANGICTHCLQQLPRTGFLQQRDNPVARVFWGRLPLEQAAALVWFQQHSAVQQLMHGIKYGGRKDAAFQLGRWMGYQLLDSAWLQQIDGLLPVPLHASRFAARGYNQAACLCEGIAQVCSLPLILSAVQRQLATSTQTRQHRKARWNNMKQVFAVQNEALLCNRHLLLVDDVVTTGASLDALGQQLRRLPGVRLSVCCFAYTAPH